MSTSRPLITVVIPTRDRPEHVTLAVQALRNQSFRDFEVIISDNALHRPLALASTVLDDQRFRLIRPKRPLWMTDHWEFAVEHARGHYVAVVGDKALLVPSALEQVAAAIKQSGADAISWMHGIFQAASTDLAGPGAVTVKRLPEAWSSRVPASEALAYLLATHLAPSFLADHQLETRGSIYHGVFSAKLIGAMRQRFGRVFRFYAPDLNSQCVAMQVAREVFCINRPLEITVLGASNGAESSVKVGSSLSTQSEAARGGSGASARLIPGVSASIAHVYASDLVYLSGHVLQRNEWAEIHRKAAFDLYFLEDWPEPGMFLAQENALLESAARLDGDLCRRLRREQWRVRKLKGRAWAGAQLRRKFGDEVATVWRAFRREEAALQRRSGEALFSALATLG